MSKTSSRIAAILALTAFALFVAGEFRAAPAPATSAPQPHVFVPTMVEIPAPDADPAPTF